jgi:hypothetical protein
MLWKDMDDPYVEIQLNDFQTLVVHFADEGIVKDVWDIRYPDEPVRTSWTLYSEYEVSEEDLDNDESPAKTQKTSN